MAMTLKERKAASSTKIDPYMRTSAKYFWTEDHDHKIQVNLNYYPTVSLDLTRC